MTPAFLVDTRHMTFEEVPFDLIGAGLRLMIIDLGETVGAVARPGAAVSAGADLALAAVAVLRSGNLASLGPLFEHATDLGGCPADDPASTSTSGWRPPPAPPAPWVSAPCPVGASWPSCRSTASAWCDPRSPPPCPAGGPRSS